METEVCDPQPLVSEETEGRLTVVSGYKENVKWDRRNLTEVEAAREYFERLRSEHFLGFRMNRDGSQGTQLHSFDASAEEILMVPPSVGG